MKHQVKKGMGFHKFEFVFLCQHNWNMLCMSYFVQPYHPIRAPQEIYETSF